MTPDQIQQLMHQQMQTVVAATPFWMKALFLLQILSLLATVVCLPLITWKLFLSTKSSRRTEQVSIEEARLQEIRAKREVMEKLHTASQPAEILRTVTPPNDDSRFRPPK